MNFCTEYNQFKKIVDEHILDYIPEIDNKSSTLYDSMKYSLTAGGKRLRSVLLLSFYYLSEKNKPQLSFALPFAEAAEFIQTYSLIHDDLPAMDNDDYRRGMLTNHKVFGEDIAILAGDGLLSAAYEVMTKDMLLYLNDSCMLKRKVKAAFELSKGTGVRGMVQGQVADVENEGKPCSSDMLEFIDDNKTAAFIKSCILCGCYLGGADSDLIEKAAVYGECIGHAFQIVDDILDVIGDEKQRGKKIGKDAELEKNTYPAVYGLEKSKEKALYLLGKARNAIYDYKAVIALNIIDFLEDELK